MGLFPPPEVTMFDAPVEVPPSSDHRGTPTYVVPPTLTEVFPSDCSCGIVYDVPAFVRAPDKKSGAAAACPAISTTATATPISLHDRDCHADFIGDSLYSVPSRNAKAHAPGSPAFGKK